MNIREARADDTLAIMKTMADVEASGYMLFAPGERKMNERALQAFIENIVMAPTSAFFVAVVEDVVGYLIVRSEDLRRTSHRASIVIGVHSSYRGKGIGEALFQHVIQWAKEKQLHRLELTVIERNKRAIHLYEKMGFHIEGIRRDALWIDNVFVNELYMSRLL